MLALVTTAFGYSPFFAQEHYRWRNDNGSETSATWKAPADTPITGVTRGTNIRLRFCIANTGSMSGSIAPQLQYSTNTSGPWAAVSMVQNGLEPFEMADSPNYTNDQITTEQLLGSGTFVMGCMVEYPKNTAASVTIGNGQYSNFEYCFKPTAKARGSVTYYFRVTGCNTNQQYAQLTMEAGEANEPPVIVSPLSVTGMINASFTYTIQASGSEPITYSVTDLPSGLGFDGVNSITGVMPGTAGTYLIGLNATNAYGTDSKTLSLTAAETGGDVLIPDDPLFGQLWGLHNVGQSNGVVDADIDAPEAWAIHTGSSNVLVGVIDTGIDYTHPDLAPNYWVNPGETGLDALGRDKRTNGVDDDGNGYVDDWRGWNFINETNDPKDDHFHGTHVAGTIGAVGNNTVGVAGVCWKVSFVALKFLGSGGSGYISDAVEATAYATRIKCALTSNSWGGGGYSQAMVDAIQEAHTNGILFVAAAGNNGADADQSPMYPAAYDNPNIISVAATTRTDEKASFSNYGAKTVDLGAPGHEILSTYPTYMTDAMRSRGDPTNYNAISGTSMATPHVSGACALLKSFDPTISHMEIKTYLMRSVDPIPALQGKTVSNGRLNIYRALKWRQEGRPLLVVDSVTIDDGTLPGTAGNSNGVAEVGETVALLVSLKNTGTNESLSGSIQLESIGSQPGVSILSGATNFAPIPATSTVEITFMVGFSPSYETTYDARFRLAVQEEDETSWFEPVTIRVYYTPPPYGAFFWGSGGTVSGNPVIQQSPAPAPIWNTSDGVVSIASASWAGHSLLVKPDGTLWVWGSGTSGQLGLGTNYQTVSVPTQIPGLSNVVASAAGGSHSLALLTDGSVWAWGAGTSGQLGLGTTNNVWTPVQIPGLSNIVSISAGYAFSVAVDTNGNVWAWGDNSSGQLGNGTTNSTLAPIKLSTISGVSAVSAGAMHTLALKTDGTVRAWGYNSYGQLGDGSTTMRTSPVQTSGLTNVRRISAGYLHSLAVKSDGTLWGWGYDNYGQSSGQSGATYRYTPVQVSGISGVTNMACGLYHTVAVKTNGSVWAWGENSYGQLGNGSMTNSYSPVQVLSLSNAVGVSARTYYSGAWTSRTGQPSNRPPVLQGGSLYTFEDTPVKCTYMAYDPDGDPLTYQMTLMPQHGTVTGIPPDMVYIPETNYYGSDEFCYKASDGVYESGEARITVTIQPVNDAPIILSGPTATPSNALVHQPVQFSVEVMDVEGHELSYLWDFQDATTDTNASPVHAYEANGNFTVSVIIDDGVRGVTTGTVAVTVTGGTNWAPVASNDTYTLNEDVPLIVQAPGVLTNDTDVDGDTLNAILVTAPTNGTLILNANGSFTYTPSNNYYGIDRFVYKPNDGKVDGNFGIVDLTILPVNDPPIASNMVVTTREDTAVGIYLQGWDVEKKYYYNLSYTIVRGPTNGTITSGTSYYRTYTPNANYYGHDSFTYKANDGELDSNIAVVDIFIYNVNDAPTVTISNSPSAGLMPLTVAFTANGSDVDGDPLTYSWTFGDGGTSTNKNPVYTYTKMGLYTASVTVRDPSNATASASTKITVRAPAGLIGYWAMDEGAGTNAVDSAMSNNGLVNGPVWTQGVHGTALWFDGTNDTVSISDKPYGGIDDNNFTMALWVKPTAGRASSTESTSGTPGTSNQRYVIFPTHGDNAYGSGHAGAGISVGTNGISVFEHASGYMPSVLVTNIVLLDSEWTHIAVVYSNHVPKLYVNGVFIKNGLVSSKIVHPGCSMGGSSYGWYQGWADDVRIYNYALSPWQVRVLAEGDWDGDWMPDAWEINYFGSTNALNGGADEDWDRDGMKNLHEYLAGTIPDDPQSLLAITDFEIVDGTNIVVRWLSVSDKFYSIQSSSNLIDGFSGIVTGGVWLLATPPVNVHTIQTEQVQRRFYRVIVEP
jgi:alpha-tubulin suppressor-like RCC1 family protein/subtilisin family serine protease